MEPRWSELIWLGRRAKSDEIIISGDTGRIVKAGDISLKTDIENRDRYVIMGVERAARSEADIHNYSAKPIAVRRRIS